MKTISNGKGEREREKILPYDILFVGRRKEKKKRREGYRRVKKKIVRNKTKKNFTPVSLNAR